MCRLRRREVSKTCQCLLRTFLQRTPRGGWIASQRHAFYRTMIVAGITHDEMLRRRAGGTLQCQYSGGQTAYRPTHGNHWLHKISRKKGSLETLVSSGFLVTISAAKKSPARRRKQPRRPQAAKLPPRPQAEQTPPPAGRRTPFPPPRGRRAKKLLQTGAGAAIMQAAPRGDAGTASQERQPINDPGPPCRPKYAPQRLRGSRR